MIATMTQFVDSLTLGARSLLKQPGLTGLGAIRSAVFAALALLLVFPPIFAQVGSGGGGMGGPGGGGPGGNGNGPLFSQTDLQLLNVVQSGTGVMITYNVLVDYDREYQPWVRIKHPDERYTDKQNLNPDSQLNVAGNTHQLFLDLGSTVLEDGTYEIVFGLVEGTPFVLGLTFNFNILDNELDPNVMNNMAIGLSFLLGETPYPNLPVDVLCGSCESTSRRGGRALCPMIGTDGLFGIKLFENGIDGGCGGPGPCQPGGGGERAICISDEVCGGRNSPGVSSGCGHCNIPSGPTGPGVGLVSLLRSSPWNTVHDSSFGPGISIDYDSNAWLAMQQTNGLDDQGAVCRLFDAEYNIAVTLLDELHGDPKDGILKDERRFYRHAHLLKAGSLVTSVAEAESLRVFRFDGRILEFEIKDEDDEPNGEQLDRMARLVSMKLLNGQQTTITYHPDSLREIQTVTDPFGNQMQFSYGTTVASRPAVTQITIPGGQQITLSYANDYLSQVNYPGGGVWSCGTGFDTVAQCSVITVNSPLAGTRAYRVAPDFMEYHGELVGQPSNFFRSATDGLGNNLLAVFPQLNNSFAVDGAKVMYGNDQLVFFSKNAYQRYYTSWQLAPGGDSFDDLTVEQEGTWSYQIFSSASDFPGTFEEQEREAFRRFIFGAPKWVYPADGGPGVLHIYDEDIFLVERQYADGSNEKFAYNSVKQLTRYKNRIGNVTLYEYDAIGNLAVRKVGLKEVNGIDTSTPEYAEFKYEYYAIPGPVFGKLKTEFSPLHSGQADIHRTDYEYWPNGRLKLVAEPADVVGGDRPATQYAWDQAGRLTGVVNSLGQETNYVYDLMGRLVQTIYPDASTEVVQYGAPATNLSHKPVWQKNRGGVVTSYSYDALGRVTEIVEASHTADNAGTALTPVTDPLQQRRTTFAYQVGAYDPKIKVVDGRKTEYFLDFRKRNVSTRTWTNSTEFQVSNTAYVDNRVFYTQAPDGSREYYGYSSSNATELIRRVRGHVNGADFPNMPSVLTRERDLTPNATFVVVDAIKDAEGNLLQTVDENGTVSLSEFDSRGRETVRRSAVGTSVETKEQTIYDAASNVVETRSPRYFDTSDPEASRMRTLFAHNGRDQQISSTLAPGAGSAQAVVSQTWTIDGKVATSMDSGGNTWSSHYNDSCCGQFLGQEDPLGHGSLSNQDAMGRTVHSAVVSDFDTAIGGTGSPLNPADGQTLTESTVRYDLLGRPVARTQWLTPRGQIDRANPPIAGLNGVPAAEGLTTQTVHDSCVGDGVGLDSAAGASIPKLGGGSYQLSLQAVLQQLGAAEAAGGAGITLGGIGCGSATVGIGPDESISVSIGDGLGRTVISAQLQPWNGPQPFALVTWTCHRPETWYTMTTHRTIDPNGKVVRSQANALGRVVEAYDEENRVTTTSYDPAGNVLSVRDPNGVGYDAVYDPLGRMTSQTDTWGDTVSMTYDREGNVLTQTDAKGKVTTMVYDARNRRKTVTDRLAGVTTFNYHPAGHLASIVDAEGQMTAYEHNARGEKIKETYPDHVNGSPVGTPGYGIVQFAYDPAGRLLRKTDQVGDTVYFNYDMASRVPQRDYRTAANSPNGPIADSDTFQFDVAGRMTSATSGRYTNVVGMTYDYAGRLSTESLSIAGQTYTVTREYDALNRIKKYIYPDGTPVERTYTDRGQLATIKYNGSVIDTRTYDLGGRLLTSTYSNGCVTTHTYRSSGSQKDNLLASIATTNPGPNKVGTYSYTWDANKNKTVETITNSPLSTHGFTTGSSGYDDENRVTNWARSDSLQTQTWSLSLVGDWNTFNQTGAAPLAQTRTHGPTHEFTSFTGTTSGALTYDVKGNLTSRPATLAAPGLNLTWDFDNRLIGADTNGSSGSLEVTFQYDALGRRVARTESGSTIIYFQAGQQIILDYTSGAAPNSPTYRFVYGDYIDEPVMRETASGSVRHFFHRNQQYSVTALTDSAGNTVERYAYTAYGALTVHNSSGTPQANSTVNNRYTYTGREWDDSTKLYHFRARWYDSATGRFVGRDPLGFVDGMSLYRANFVPGAMDPHGREKWDIDKNQCEITLTVKVEFEFIDQTGDSWTLARKNSFQSKFENAVEDAFNNHRFRIFPLQQKKDFHWKDDNCNCDCFLNGFHPKLDIEFGWWYEDFLIEVKANKGGSWIESFAEPGGPRAFLDEHDVYVYYLEGDRHVPTWQITAVHEFGHLLGMLHPGQYLPDPPRRGSFADYEADAPALMGRGHEMRALYFEKWRSELNRDYGNLGCVPFTTKEI